MTIDRRTLEGIEACRPGSDDLQSPELADVASRVEDDPQAKAAYARVQSWDAAVVSAMERVAVPEGLADRILARMNSGESATALDDAVRDAVHRGGEASPARVRLPRAIAARPRHQWVAAAMAVAATAAVAVFLAQYLSTSSDTPLETMADGWLAELEPKWQNMRQAPGEFAVPGAIRVEAVGWQKVGQFPGIHGAAYKLAHATAGTARLFVMKLSASGLPATPPPLPQFATGGRSIGYWQSGKLVYVLVVDGDQHKYRAFVNSAPMPLAWNRPVSRSSRAGIRRLGRTIGKIV